MAVPPSLPMMLRALVLAAMLGAVPALQAQSTDATVSDSGSAGSALGAVDAVTLRSGDMLRIKVWKNEDMSGDFEVAPDGTLRHALYNRLRVAGVPVGELRSRVREFLLEFEQEPQVEVEPLLRVVVGGEVRSPNVYMLGPEVTLVDAIARAGGATSEGRLSKVTLEREGDRRTLDLTRPADVPGRRTIRSGDQIMVARRRQILRDYIGPVASVAATIVSLLTLARR